MKLSPSFAIMQTSAHEASASAKTAAIADRTRAKRMKASSILPASTWWVRVASPVNAALLAAAGLSTMGRAMNQYVSLLYSLLADRAKGLPVEEESRRVEELDSSWWRLTNEEQQRVEDELRSVGRSREGK